MEVAVDTSQIRILQDFFNDLAHIDQKKIFMTAYRRAARPLVAAAKVTAPGEGLKKSIGTIEMPERVSILVGSKTNTIHMITERGRQLISKVWYGHLFEWGTKERFRKPTRKIKRGFYKGQYRGISKGTGATGKITATHFFENAYNTTESKVFDSIEGEWYQAIDKMIIRTNKRLR